jgi:hypothetical protein
LDYLVRNGGSYLIGDTKSIVGVAIASDPRMVYAALIRAEGEQNGMIERLTRTLKEQCVHRHRFETLRHASRVIGDWIGFYNHVSCCPTCLCA